MWITKRKIEVGSGQFVDANDARIYANGPKPEDFRFRAGDLVLINGIQYGKVVETLAIMTLHGWRFQVHIAFPGKKQSMYQFQSMVNGDGSETVNHIVKAA